MKHERLGGDTAGSHVIVVIARASVRLRKHTKGII
jgi:hypothetical protein